jgi:hypothetical protein
VATPGLQGMMLSRHVRGWLLLSSLLVGCDHDDAAATATLQQTWDQECERMAACAETAAEAASCKASYACMEGAMGPDALAASVQCQTERECGSSNDPCFSPTLLEIPESPVAAGFRADCLARRAECASGPDQFGDDYCINAALFQDPVVTALASCLEAGCGEVDGCFEARLADVVPACVGRQ